MGERARASLIGLTLVMSVGFAGCSDGDGQAEATTDGLDVLDADFVPEELFGLSVETEPLPESIENVEGSYLEAVRLYGLRDDALVATLQVGRFDPDADFRSEGFRRALLEQIGGTRPREIRVGDQTVFLTTGVRQNLAVWFSNQHMMVLGIREEFTRPRGLLRSALETIEIPGGT